MKNLENMKALNEMELAMVAGGDDNASILDVCRDWMMRMPTEMPIKPPSKRGKC